MVPVGYSLPRGQGADGTALTRYTLLRHAGRASQTPVRWVRIWAAGRNLARHPFWGRVDDTLCRVVPTNLAYGLRALCHAGTPTYRGPTGRSSRAGSGGRAPRQAPSRRHGSSDQVLARRSRS